MHPSTIKTGLELRSLIRANGELEISLARVDVSKPADDEVVVRVQASPINPSDLGILVGTADMAQASPPRRQQSRQISVVTHGFGRQVACGIRQSIPDRR